LLLSISDIKWIFANVKKQKCEQTIQLFCDIVFTLVQACCLRGVSIGGRENHWPVARTIFITLLHTVVVFFATILEGGGPLASGQNHLHHAVPHRGGFLYMWGGETIGYSG
jgi:hypothetical protein